MQARSKQVKSGEAISDIWIAYSARAKHALTRGVWGHAPPEKVFNFSSSEVAFEPVAFEPVEVAFEPVSANSIASTTPRNRGTTALLSFADRILFGELEFARLVRMIANRRGH